jgi:hypothetical protein
MPYRYVFIGGHACLIEGGDRAREVLHFELIRALGRLEAYLIGVNTAVPNPYLKGHIVLDVYQIEQWLIFGGRKMFQRGAPSEVPLAGRGIPHRLWRT